MDNKEMKFHEETEGKRNICASESATKAPGINYPVVIISHPKSNEAKNYECNVTILGKEVERNQEIGSYMRNGKRYDAQAESGCTLSGVLVNNGSAVNVLPLSTLTVTSDAHYVKVSDENFSTENIQDPRDGVTIDGRKRSFTRKRIGKISSGKDGSTDAERSAIADFLASRALEDYESFDFDFPDEDLMYVANTEENP
ncbi:hypothetical protein GOBAR_DD25963 [Gossypium barbadense]|nr:hypothetical protein GOBAR_DD25963 [Gossypium barbadense]